MIGDTGYIQTCDIEIAYVICNNLWHLVSCAFFKCVNEICWEDYPISHTKILYGLRKPYNRNIADISL